MEQMLQLTPAQFDNFLSFCSPREGDERKLQYEKPPAYVKQTLKKFVERYRKAGMKVPGAN